MMLLRLLWKQSPGRFAAVILCSVACAVLMMLLVRVIALFVSNPAAPPVSLLLFAVLAISTTALQLCASALMQYTSAQMVRTLRGQLVGQIADAPVPEIESRGSAKLLNGLGEDAMRIGISLPSVVALTRDLVFALACLLYLLWLSPIVFGVLFGAIVVGAFLHRPVQGYANSQLRVVRNLIDRQFTLYRNLVDGAKQTKLGERLRVALLEAISGNQARISRLVVKGSVAMSVANAVAVLLFLALVGTMMYANLAAFLDPALVATYTLIVFFLLSPLQNIFASAQAIGQANVAAMRISSLRDALAQVREVVPQQALQAEAVAPLVIELRGITYSYSNNTQFTVGPVDLTLRSGEVLFVVGGNGSGKTTLIKLLCGLYPPAAGEIRLNGVGIDNENRVHYRRHISAIFSDSVVMDGLAGSAYDKAVSAHPDLVRRLMLERAVKADNGLLEQAGGFSTGERKRFNLLLALLDQRPVLVFDEFAADQDPDAKAFFYRDVLPELKAQGRIVVVVTHDDRYFPVADRTLALERGMRPMLTDQGLALRVVRSAAAPEIAALVGDAQ